MKREIQFFCRETDEIIHRVDVSRESESACYKITRGMRINLDTSRYYIKLVTTPAAPGFSEPTLRKRKTNEEP